MVRKWRSGAGLIFSLGLILAMAGSASLALGGGSAVRADSPPFKVELCHATNAEGNPYTRNNVSFNSIADAETANGHGTHTGPIWVAGDKEKDITWGDIIPEYYYPTGVPAGSTFHYTGMNWTTEGQAIWNNVCNIPGPPPTEKKNVVVTTTVIDATTTAAWAGTETAPASAYDTARVVPPSVFPVPTGTVTYIFYSTGNCVSPNALGTDHSTVALSAGSVPNSKTESELTEGSYSFKAIYSGDSHYKGNTSVCEPFTVAEGPYDPSTTTTTVVFNAGNNAPLVGNLLPVNGSAYDTSTVKHVGGGTPTGTIAYTFYTNNSCSGDGTSAGSGLTLGTKSDTKGPLAAGQYSFKASYTSNTADFNSSASVCEPFTVSPAQLNPTPSPTGGVLAATGATPPTQDLAISLIALGLIAMMGGAFAWRRREA